MNAPTKNSTVILKSSTDFDACDVVFMHMALDLARQGAALGEVPVGAVLVYENQPIAHGFNCPITQKDSTAHAEIVALRAACRYFDNYRLPKNCTMYVTLEPCTMCLGALIHARVDRVVFATTEPKAGVMISQEQLAQKTYFNHYMHVEGGLLAQDSKLILQEFFQKRRKQKITQKN